MFGEFDGMLILAIVLFITGFVLVGIEMITPGLHAPGLIGMVCLLAGIFIVSDSVMEGAVITIFVLAVLGVMLAIILGMLSRGKLKSPIILKDEQNKHKGYISSSDLNYLLGKRGVAITDLRPTGTGCFEEIDFDVISEGRYIPKGTQLVIYKVQGSKLIVKAVE